MEDMANELEDHSELSDDDASHSELSDDDASLSESSDDYVKSQARIKRKVDNNYLQHFPRKSYQEQPIRPYCLCFYKTQTLLISGM